MRKGILAGVAGLTILCWFGCSFSVGTKADLATGLALNYKGLSLEDGYLSVGDQKLTSKEVSLGTKVVLVLEGVGGFTEAEGKIYPGASMTVTAPDGTKVIDEADLFAQYEATGVSAEAAKSLTLSLSTGEPMVAGQVYTWNARIWDKKGKGEITASVKLTMK